MEIEEHLNNILKKLEEIEQTQKDILKMLYDRTPTPGVFGPTPYIVTSSSGTKGKEVGTT